MGRAGCAELLTLLGGNNFNPLGVFPLLSRRAVMCRGGGASLWSTMPSEIQGAYFVCTVMLCTLPMPANDPETRGTLLPQTQFPSPTSTLSLTPPLH